MKEECLICKAPLEYLEADELMECAICHKKENSKTRCVKGHYVWLGWGRGHVRKPLASRGCR